MKPVRVKTNSTGTFYEFEKGGNGTAYIIGDTAYQPKDNLISDTIVEPNRIHGKFKIETGDTAVELIIDSDGVEFTVFEYVIRQGEGKGYVLWKMTVFKQIIQRIDFALNQFINRSYGNMLSAAWSKCYDPYCTTSYYESEE